jgi:Kef-type K+ transport system membrane component KefB
MSFLSIIGSAIGSIGNSSLFVNQSIIVSLSVVVIVAAVLALISKILKQELILAYILAGIIMGPLVLGLIRDTTLINGLAEIGITFLLFAAGLEMNIQKIKGKVSSVVITTIIQVISVAIVAFLALIAFKFSSIEALWVGIAISLSSTVVVTKILSDKNELNTMHARLIMGIMLVQDIIAIAALAILSRENSSWLIVLSLLKLIGLIVLAFVLNKVIRPVFKKAASSTELLFIVSLALLFLFVFLSYILGLSIAIGAFIAGILVANTQYKIEIESKTKSLRDFFSIIFFVAIGMWLTNLSKEILLPLIPILLILLIVQTLMTTIPLRLLGYKVKTGIQVGFAFAQVSEFSLILVLSALNWGIISQNAFDIVVLAAVISMAATPYTMRLAGPLSKFFETAFSFIKIPTHKESSKDILGKKTILLIGCHRMGSIYLKNLEKYGDKVLVVDFNPEIAENLEKKGISCIYGDTSSHEFLNKIPIKYLKIVLSTVPAKEDNLLIIGHFKKISKGIFVVVTARTIEDALEFYDAGADYVILPEVISAEQSLDIIKKTNRSEFKKLKQDHIKYLKELHKVLY